MHCLGILAGLEQRLDNWLPRSGFFGDTSLFVPLERHPPTNMENPADQDNEEEGGGGFKMEHVQSYLKFARIALRRRWLAVASILALGLGLTVCAAIYWPRTYSCTTVLMALGSPVLDGRDTVNALAGAQDLILRHENLKSIIHDIDLSKKQEARRTGLPLLKDKVMRAILGPMTDDMKMKALVGTLETKIDVQTEKGDLTIKVSWSDAQTAQELAAAARDSFVKARHTAEISAFEEKMAILDGHGTKLREEIGVLAEQLKAVRDQKIGEVREMRSEANKVKAAEVAAAQRLVVRAPLPASVQPDTQTPELKAKLEALKARLASTESDREQRLRAAQAKLDELRVKLTPQHPEVVAQQKQIALLSGVPSELALMRAEAADMEAVLQQRRGSPGGGSTAGAGGGAASRATAVAELLPPDVADLLQRDNLDPALTAQLSSTVLKYGALRDGLLTTRIELDTAQAAFNHRYQVIIPADAPTKPDKPKPALIVVGGLLLSLLLSLVLPVLSELRKGVLAERWQVEDLQLPVLAELHLPPYSPD